MVVCCFGLLCWLLRFGCLGWVVLVVMLLLGVVVCSLGYALGGWWLFAVLDV